MAIDPASLLAGPRGRRLCLEWARSRLSTEADEHRLSSAIFFAGHHLDPASGTSRVLFGNGPEVSSPPTPTAAEVAQLIAAAPMIEPDAPGLRQALTTAVDSARYWQEPDGEDILAAAPEMRGALARVATALAASPHTAWWDSPLEDHDQWSVEFDGTAVDDAPVETSGATLAGWRVARTEEEALAERDWPADPRAAFGGPWWSKPPGGLTCTSRVVTDAGPARLSLVEDALGWEGATAHRVLTPRDARVYEIEGPDSWAALCRLYPVEVTASRRQVWYQTTGHIGRWVMPDWAAVAADFDAVHLTVTGYLATAGRAIPVDDDTSTVLAGWDPDLTNWLIDVATDPGTEQAWRRLQGEDWIRIVE